MHSNNYVRPLPISSSSRVSPRFNLTYLSLLLTPYDLRISIVSRECRGFTLFTSFSIPPVVLRFVFVPRPLVCTFCFRLLLVASDVLGSVIERYLQDCKASTFLRFVQRDRLKIVLMRQSRFWQSEFSRYKNLYCVLRKKWSSINGRILRKIHFYYHILLQRFDKGSKQNFHLQFPKLDEDRTHNNREYYL